MNRVIHFEIQADNVERAIKFYKNALGWKITKWPGEAGGMDYWMIETGNKTPGINGGLYQRSEGKDKFYLYDCTIGVADLDKAMADVKAGGGMIIRNKMEIPKVGWFARAVDTEDNRFGLMQATDMRTK
ncbi:hypothetical protein A3H09_00855 [Candidatus Falkowbacteria bacterium RIFCSPLOWO2_12_FULL_45_13]|uniref:VOC domain-containing protein n=1 Tax=Candidatus Falkowbacteria bacterium RIFCSPLOWO2_12_FULL_45_13 TaxID=1797991 RepID=A0A1F5SV70_9BACT|nr:MAG: hypothetical protein A3H09_00855 [Candidatus Falkowbacteria bacterium RIFCSPLOWO2_12_FULL_45_13]